MELLIAILACLGLSLTPDSLNDEQFLLQNQANIERAHAIMDNDWYSVDGGVVIIDEVSQ